MDPSEYLGVCASIKHVAAFSASQLDAAFATGACSRNSVSVGVMEGEAAIRQLRERESDW